MYPPQELRDVVDKLSATDYRWETGEHLGALCKMPITYLIGHPPFGVPK